MREGVRYSAGVGRAMRGMRGVKNEGMRWEGEEVREEC